MRAADMVYAYRVFVRRPAKFSVMPFLSFRVRHRYVYFLLSASLLFVGYHFVPSLHVCHEGVSWKYSEFYLSAHCTNPPFVVNCRKDSRYQRNYGQESLCRLKYQRLAKIVDGKKVRAEECKAQMGPLASYDSEKGCVCDFLTVEIKGICQFTDSLCRLHFGSGAYARVDSETGYARQCDCTDGTYPPCEPSLL